MSKLVKAVRESLIYESGKSGQHALEYIETGNRETLGRIRPGDPNRRWLRAIGGALPAPDALEEEDRRALQALAAARAYHDIGQWFALAVAREEEGQDFQGLVAAELSAIKVPTAFIDTVTVAMVDHFARDGRVNSAGRHVLTLSDEETRAALLSVLNTTGKGIPILAGFSALTEFLLEAAPDRVEPLFPVLLHRQFIAMDVCKVLLAKGEGRHDSAVATVWREIPAPSTRMDLAKIMHRHSPERYGPDALDFARSILTNLKHPWLYHDAAIWALESFGEAMIDEVVSALDRQPVPDRGWDEYRRQGVMAAAVKLFGAKALPVVLAAPARIRDADTLYASLTQLIQFGDPTLDDHIRAGLTRGIDDAEKIRTPFHGYDPNGPVISFINLAARWNPSSVEDRLWGHLGHKLKDVRAAAARALGKIGPEVVPRAAALLGDAEPEVRASAVIVLATARTPEGLEALEKRLEIEDGDDLRDAILEIVDAARIAAGREVTPEEIAGRIQRAAPKLKAPPAKWLDESRLPPLVDVEGKPLGPEATRYLFYRQSRAKEMKLDVEARPLHDRIDRSTSGDFALEVLRQFAGSKAEAKDRWALAIAGLLGDDRVVPVLAPMIHAWGDSSRFKMAELAVHALALLGTEAALLGVDATAIRYRTKNKSVGAAAREAFAEAAGRLGVTVDELGDLVVPRLGFEPGRQRVVGAEGKRVEVGIGPDFKLKYRDLEKNKAVSSPPKSLPKETLAEFKETAASLREVAKVQKARLENLMVRQFRWSAPRWAELFLDHPVLFLPFATRLIWMHHDESGARVATFRALEDRTLTGPADEAIELPGSGTVGIVHPLELDGAELEAWRTHLADYEIEPPFLQLDRPVVRVEDERRSVTLADDVAGVSLNVMTFRSRADKLGWLRGPVVDAGTVDVYLKSFPNAGIDAFLEISGLYMRIDVEASMDLGGYFFLREGTVRSGQYVMNMPDREERYRRIPLGDLPPLVYSEVAGDARRIAGTTTTGGDAEPAEE